MSLATFFRGIADWAEKKAPVSPAGDIAHASWGGLAIWALIGFIVCVVYGTIQHLVTEAVLGVLLHAFYAWAALHGLQVLCSTAIRGFEVFEAYRDGRADDNDVQVLAGQPPGAAGTPPKSP